MRWSEMTSCPVNLELKSLQELLTGMDLCFWFPSNVRISTWRIRRNRILRDCPLTVPCEEVE